jgi:hypothetical protein
VSNNEKLLVEFEPDVLAEILLATYLCEVEISGMARVRREGRKFKVYSEALLFEQTCSLSRTEPDVEAYGLWVNNMTASGDEDKIAEVDEQKLWWHSHVWFPVIFSGTDFATMKRLLSGLSEWWLVLVLNKRNERCLALIEKNDGYLKYEETPLLLNPDISESEFRKLLNSKRDSMQKIIDQRVKVERI